MNDDEWLGKLVACGDLPKVWQALNRARRGESDSVSDLGRMMAEPAGS